MKPFLCNGNANTESCKIKFQFRLLVDKDQYGNLVNIRTLLVKPRGRKIEKKPIKHNKLLIVFKRSCKCFSSKVCTISQHFKLLGMKHCY